MPEARMYDEKTKSNFVLEWSDDEKKMKLICNNKELLQIDSLESLKQGIPFIVPTTDHHAKIRYVKNIGPIDDYIEIDINGRKIKGKDKDGNLLTKFNVFEGFFDLFTTYLDN